MATSRKKSDILLYLVVTAVFGLATFLFWKFFGKHVEGQPSFAGWWRIPWLVLLSGLGYASIRVINALLFDFAFRLRQGYEAPTLVRNIFTLVAFVILFVVIFSKLYQEVNLGALFTTSAIFGVIIGLALQDTLGNFFAGISLHADRPFQVGDVVVLGQQQLTGVVEGITWRAIKILTFKNHIFLVRNSSAAKESI